ncbi:MAG: hypothetical protein ACRDN1_24820 [Trebonia sp.]
MLECRLLLTGGGQAGLMRTILDQAAPSLRAPGPLLPQTTAW